MTAFMDDCARRSNKVPVLNSTAKQKNILPGLLILFIVSLLVLQGYWVFSALQRPVEKAEIPTTTTLPYGLVAPHAPNGDTDTPRAVTEAAPAPAGSSQATTHTLDKLSAYQKLGLCEQKGSCIADQQGELGKNLQTTTKSTIHTECQLGLPGCKE